MNWIIALLALVFASAPEYVCREPGVEGKRRSILAAEIGFDQGEGWHVQARFGAKFAAELGTKGVNECSKSSRGGKSDDGCAVGSPNWKAGSDCYSDYRVAARKTPSVPDTYFDDSLRLIEKFSKRNQNSLDLGGVHDDRNIRRD